MPAAISTLRGTLATALTNNALWTTFAYPPTTIIANSLIIVPGDPYIEMSNGTYSTVSALANFKVIMNVPLFSNEGNLNGIETMFVAVFNLLAASTTISARVTGISAPSVLTVPSGDLLTCDMSVNILVNWS